MVAGEDGLLFNSMAKTGAEICLRELTNLFNASDSQLILIYIPIGLRTNEDFIRSDHSNPRKRIIREVHPEVCFLGLNGCPEMKYNKKSALGICERMQVLDAYSKYVNDIFDKTRSRYKKNQVADDDIIDALVDDIQRSI